MVESTAESAGCRMMKKQACVSALCTFFTPIEQYQLQELNKRVYEVLQYVINVTQIAQCNVILSKKGTEFYLSRVTNTSEETHKYWKLFSIGGEDNKEAREYSAATLGFSSLLDQYFVKVDEFNYFAWPVVEGAFINQGYKMKFDQLWQLISSEKIACPPERLMRPTITPVASQSGNCDYFFCGGVKEKNSFYYDTMSDTWTVCAQLPPAHQITNNVICNWKNRAIFTFVLDGKLGLKSAFLNLQTMTREPTIAAQSTQMSWALEMNAASRNDATSIFNDTHHFIDRFSLKCATVMDDDTIMLCARGRTPGMEEQVGTLFLRFRVIQKGDIYSLSILEVQRTCGIVYPRQFDTIQRSGKNLVLTQDTNDNDDFELMSVSTDMKSTSGLEQQHKVLYIDDFVDSPTDMIECKI